MYTRSAHSPYFNEGQREMKEQFGFPDIITLYLFPVQKDW